MSKTPIEEFAEAKRSGRFHPETLKNWPEPESDENKSPNPQKPSPIYEEKPKKVRTYTKYIHYAFAAWLLILTIAILILHWPNRDNSTASKPFKEAPPVAKAKIKKVYVTKTSDKWRKKLCYGYGDWSACLAYKTGLPSRARVGRTDLN